MNMKRMICVLMAFLLVFTVTVFPAFAADETKKDITVIRGDGTVKDDNNDEDTKDTTSDDDSAMDTIISDDTIFGFDINKNHDLSQDISVQNAIDLASSLPPWKLLIVLILLLSVVIGLTYIVVIQMNLFKGGKAATNENPQKAAQGIKDSKMINRAYTEEIIEGALFIGGMVFLVLLFS